MSALGKVLGEGMYQLLEQPEWQQGDRVEFSLPFESLDAAQRVLLGLGTAIEVLAPVELRERLQQMAASVAAFYVPARSL